MFTERRRYRSNIPVEAIRMYLEALARKLGIESIALATEDGFTIAGYGKCDLELLSALGATSGSRAENRHAMIDQVAGEKPLFTCELDVGHKRLYLATVGQGVNLGDVTQAVSRILFPAPLF